MFKLKFNFQTVIFIKKQIQPYQNSKTQFLLVPLSKETTF